MASSRRAAPSFTSGEAQYALERLIRDRTISPDRVRQLIAEMHSEIEELESRLAALRQVAGSSAGRTRRRDRNPSGTVTAIQAASRKLQGEYMGLLRHTTGAMRARMKKLAQETGREAAVKAMRAALRK